MWDGRGGRCQAQHLLRQRLALLVQLLLVGEQPVDEGEVARDTRLELALCGLRLRVGLGQRPL